MGGRLPLDYDAAKAKSEIDRLIAIDSASYRMIAQQSLGRAVRGGFKKGKITCLAAGKGKTMIGVNVPFAFDEKRIESTDIKQADIDYIGELIIDTRNYDPDEENMGIVVMESSVISLIGGVATELRFRERLNSIDVPILLGIDKLDECEVDIGVFRYVFSFKEYGSIITDFVQDTVTDLTPQLISKHKYPYADEEFLVKEYTEDCSEG